jgi:hypothetical protein
LECEGIIPPFYYPIVSFSSICDLKLNCSTNIAFAYMIYLNTCVCVLFCFPPGSLRILVWFDSHVRIVNGDYVCKPDEESEVLQVGVGALSVFVALLFATVPWSMRTVEQWRYDKSNNEQIICC